MFFVDRNSEISTKQLLGRLNIYGDLSIKEMQNITNPLETLAMDLKNKTLLLKLKLKWKKNHILMIQGKKRKYFRVYNPPNTQSVCQLRTTMVYPNTPKLAI